MKYIESKEYKITTNDRVGLSAALEDVFYGKVRFVDVIRAFDYEGLSEDIFKWMEEQGVVSMTTTEWENFVETADWESVAVNFGFWNYYDEVGYEKMRSATIKRFPQSVDILDEVGKPKAPSMAERLLKMATGSNPKEEREPAKVPVRPARLPIAAKANEKTEVPLVQIKTVEVKKEEIAGSQEVVKEPEVLKKEVVVEVLQKKEDVKGNDAKTEDAKEEKKEKEELSSEDKEKARIAKALEGFSKQMKDFLTKVTPSYMQELMKSAVFNVWPLVLAIHQEMRKIKDFRFYGVCIAVMALRKKSANTIYELMEKIEVLRSPNGKVNKSLIRGLASVPLKLIDMEQEFSTMYGNWIDGIVPENKSVITMAPGMSMEKFGQLMMNQANGRNQFEKSFKAGSVLARDHWATSKDSYVGSEALIAEAIKPWLFDNNGKLMVSGKVEQLVNKGKS